LSVYLTVIYYEIMKNLKIIIPVLLLFVIQLILMINNFVRLITVIGLMEESVFSNQKKMLFMGSFFIIIVISVIFIIILFKNISQKPKEIIVEVPVKKENSRAERRRRNLEEQKRLSELEKQRNRTINNIMNGINDKLDKKEFSEKLLSNLSKQFDLVQGMVFLRNEKSLFTKTGTYAYYSEDEVPDFEEGVGIAGQVAANKEMINITNLPDRYLTVVSGLGSSAPANLLIFPILHNNKTIGIVEMATFKKIEKFGENVIKVLMRRLGEDVAKIIAKKEEKNTKPDKLQK